MNDLSVAIVTVVVDDDSFQNRTDTTMVNDLTKHLPSLVESTLRTVPVATEEQQVSQVRCGRWLAAWSVVAEEIVSFSK
jgi:hypothetical protein